MSRLTGLIPATAQARRTRLSTTALTDWPQGAFRRASHGLRPVRSGAWTMGILGPHQIAVLHGESRAPSAPLDGVAQRRVLLPAQPASLKNSIERAARTSRPFRGGPASRAGVIKLSAVRERQIAAEEEGVRRAHRRVRTGDVL